ncbi:MAG TPA: hypothetical protein VHN14_28060 [Kofleriaceae bacterium]|nr:hypothetical protein [Kofleriaceae bacterium]
MRGAVALAAFALWVSSASAGPGVIVASRANVLEAPSEAARVVFVIGHGAAVCVLDESDYTGVVHHRPGWLALRIRGSGGVGYVRTEAIGPVAASSTAATSCGESASVSVMPPTAPATALVAPIQRWQASEPSPVQARSPVMAGRFLPLHPARLMFGLGSGVAWLSEQSAAQHRIDSSGPTVHFSGTLTIYDIFSISASGGAVFPSDHASFTEQVVPEQGGGDPTTASSSLTVERYSIVVGLRTPFLALFPTKKGWFAGALYADYGTAGISGSRSISDCIDCRSEHLDFPGGTFWRVGLDLATPSSSPKPVQGDFYGYGFTAAYQHYQAGAGLIQELQVGLTIWLL